MSASQRFAWLALALVAAVVVPMRLVEIFEANQARHAAKAEALTMTARK